MPGEHITQEQADEYAIGALEPQLERVVALHLAECPACRDIARDSERLAATLALGAPSRRASRKLRRRVWTAAGIRRPTPFQRAIRVAPAAAAVAAVFVAILAFTGMVSIRGQVNDLRAENTNLKTEINDALSQKVEIAVLQERLSDEEAASAQLRESARGDRDLLLAVMSPESDTAGVTATEGNDPAIGRLIWDENQKRVWFVANRLPSLPRGETYHMWVNSNGKYYSVGTFNTDSAGFARYEATMPEGLTNYDSFVVTRETTGAEARQGDAVFVAVLSNLKN
jgi:hypothetical protein